MSEREFFEVTKGDEVEIINNGSYPTMNVYMVGYGTHEESEYNYLLHEKDFTQDEFEQIIFNSVYKCILAEKKKEHSYLHDYGGIHGNVVDFMIKNHGFKELKPKNSWVCFGWASMFKPSDWDTASSSEIGKLVSFLNGKGLTVEDDDFLNRHGEHNTSPTKVTDET